MVMQPGLSDAQTLTQSVGPDGMTYFDAQLLEATQMARSRWPALKALDDRALTTTPDTGAHHATEAPA